MDHNRMSMERWSDLQKKYDDGQSLMQKYQQTIEDLSSKVTELKDLNSQLDYSWSEKYRQLEKTKDLLEREARGEGKRRLEEEKHAKKSEIDNLKHQFHSDLTAVEHSLS